MVVWRCEEVRLETGPTPLAPLVSCRTVKTPGTGVPLVRTGGTAVPQLSQLWINQDPPVPTNQCFSKVGVFSLGSDDQRGRLEKTCIAMDERPFE